MFVVIVWWGGIGAGSHPCGNIVHAFKVTLVHCWMTLCIWLGCLTRGIPVAAILMHCRPCRGLGVSGWQGLSLWMSWRWRMWRWRSRSSIGHVLLGRAINIWVVDRWIGCCCGRIQARMGHRLMWDEHLDVLACFWVKQHFSQRLHRHFNIEVLPCLGIQKYSARGLSVGAFGVQTRAVTTIFRAIGSRQALRATQILRIHWRKAWRVAVTRVTIRSSSQARWLR